jgi:hypothetical protein
MLASREFPPRRWGGRSPLDGNTMVLPARLLPVLGAAVLVMMAAMPPAQHHGSLLQTISATRQPDTAAPQPLVAAGEQAAKAYCVACHAFPPPSVLPRHHWRDQVARMHAFMRNEFAPAATGSGKIEPLPPEWQAIVAYYEAHAPERLPDPPAWPAPGGPLTFRRHAISPQGLPRTPAVANVRLVDVEGDGRPELLATDMRHGVILLAHPYDPKAPVREIAQVPHPAHIEPVDYDGDGLLDFLVGDLGALLPVDHDRGAVVWLRGRKDGTWVQMRLEGWPRVSDVQPVDIDGDGKLDLAVAAFGWRKTGNLTLLRNETTDYDEPSFSPFLLDPRTGAIHTPPVDLNGDGRMDLVVLFAQEHETVVAYLNTGAGFALQPQTIYTAPHPNWGSSGIQVVDLDGDGDLDVLLTHGDMFDDRLLKPYHGIIWLENRGTFPFTAHTLAKMPGVHRAQAADMDGDGDLDIVACALVPSDEPTVRELPALVWLEQVKPGVFERHTIAQGMPVHATLDLGDIDGDGDIDVVVGNFSTDQPLDHWIEVWENLRK